MNTATIFSCNEKYRYTLWRTWDDLFDVLPENYINFICLNPSTATATKDDPTVAKLTRWAKAWGYDALCVTNIFALRSTDPQALYSEPDPIGPDSDKYILDIAMNAALVVCAWGRHGNFLERGKTVSEMIKRNVCILEISTVHSAQPKHPLYLPGDIKPQIWRCRASSDGECFSFDCPQIRDGEPERSKRHCPLDRDYNDETII